MTYNLSDPRISEAISRRMGSGNWEFLYVSDAGALVYSFTLEHIGLPVEVVAEVHLVDIV